MDEFIQLVKTEPAKKRRGRPRKVQQTGEGLGDILTSVKKTAQKVARNVGSKILGKKLAEKVERYGDAVLFLNKLPLSPAVKEILRKHGDEPILKMVACRTPVRKVLNGLMNAVSLGSFNKKFSRLPYDDLFHLSLWITTASGTYSVEKEEVIKIKSNPRTEEHAEFNEISPVPSALTMNKLMMGGEKILGDRFTRYDASSNNCQDFIIALLDGSNVGSAADKAFIKQNTDSLFKDDSFLRRFARKLTNLGASVSTAITGVDDTPVASTKTASQFEIPSHADTSVSDGVEGGAGKRKAAVVGDRGERGRVVDLIRRAYPPAGQEADPVSFQILDQYARGVVPRLRMARVPDEVIGDALSFAIPRYILDPYAEPVATARVEDMGAVDKRRRREAPLATPVVMPRLLFSTPPPPTGSVVVEELSTPPQSPVPTQELANLRIGNGRNRKIPKKAEKGQRTIPEMTAAQEARAVRLAREFTDPSAPPSLMSRVHELIARRQRGELDSNFNELRTPTEPPTPESSQGAGMVKRGRGRPRKLVGGYTPAQIERAIVDMLDAKEGALRSSGMTTKKLASVKKGAKEFLLKNPSYPLTLDEVYSLYRKLWSEY